MKQWLLLFFGIYLSFPGFVFSQDGMNVLNKHFYESVELGSMEDESKTLGSDASYRMVRFANNKNYDPIAVTLAIYADKTKSHADRGTVIVRWKSGAVIRVRKFSVSQDEVEKALMLFADEEIFSLPRFAASRDDNDPGNLMAQESILFQRLNAYGLSEVIRDSNVSGPVERAKKVFDRWFAIGSTEVESEPSK